MSARYSIRELGTDFQLLDERGEILASHFDPDAFIRLTRLRLNDEEFARLWQDNRGVVDKG